MSSRAPEPIEIQFEGTRVTIEGLGHITSGSLPAWLRIVAKAIEREQERGQIRLFNWPR